VSETPYSVTAIDLTRKLQGNAELPLLTDGHDTEVEATDIILKEMSGGIDGVVLDPLGRPIGGVSVLLKARIGSGVAPIAETTSAFDGRFSFDNVPVAEDDSYVVAHLGDGLEDDHIGYIGKAAVRVAYGGHRPFVSVPLRGSGRLEITVYPDASANVGVLSQIYYKPTYYSETERDITLRGAYIHRETGGDGTLEVELPVGAFSLTAYNAFDGLEEVDGTIEYAGQVI
jgi:hypothetical protein